jgi:hypothetical protein
MALKSSTRPADAVGKWETALDWRRLGFKFTTDAKAVERFTKDGEVECECGTFVVAALDRLRKHKLSNKCTKLKDTKEHQQTLPAYPAAVPESAPARAKRGALRAVVAGALVALGLAATKIASDDMGVVAAAIRKLEPTEHGALGNEDTIRRSYVPSTYDLMKTHIMTTLGNAPYSVIVDGATAAFRVGDSMLNVIVDSAYIDTPFLIGCFVKKGGTTAELIKTNVLAALSSFSLSVGNVVALVADGASNNILAAKVRRAVCGRVARRPHRTFLAHSRRIAVCASLITHAPLPRTLRAHRSY